MTNFGFVDHILEVDLTRGSVEKVPVDPDVMRRYLGGMGLAGKMLYNRQPMGADAFDPENLFIVSPGSLGGTLAPASGRVEITTRSPLTGMLASANAGGHWGPSLRSAGYEAVVFTGQSPHPVYLLIDDDRVELRDASSLWGKDAWSTADALKPVLPGASPDRVNVLSIGPAGENRVRFAAITADYHNSASRCGVGAVMGAKRLKAIVAHGTGSIPIADPRRMEEVAFDYFRKGDPHLMGAPGQSYLRSRSVSMMRRFGEGGMLPGHNFQTTVLPNWQSRHLEANLPYIRAAGESCYTCHLADGCVHIKSGKYKGVSVGDIHSMFIWCWGAQCGIESLPAVYKCEELCERLGIDTLCGASTIAFAIELFQRGLITEKDTGGLVLRWGDEDVIHELMYRIARREGLGDLLAEGSLLAGKKIGQGAEKYSMTVGGMAPLSIDHRVYDGAGQLGHLTSPRAGDNLKTTHFAGHLAALPTIRPPQCEGMSQQEYERWFIDHQDIFDDVKDRIFGKERHLGNYDDTQIAHLTKWNEDQTALHNSLGTCIIALTGPTHLAGLYSAATGIETSPRELMGIGERINNLHRLLNARWGIMRGAVDWPDRFYEEPVPDGPQKGRVISRERMARALDAYYDVRGWDRESGMPGRAKLEELGLSDLVAALEAEAIRPFAGVAPASTSR